MPGGVGLPWWEFDDQKVQDNFEWLSSQTERIMRDSFVHTPQEALGEVTTTSSTFVTLSGGPTLTIEARPGLMVAVLVDAELKDTVNSAVLVVELDSTGTYICGTSELGGTYQRRLSAPDLTGADYPAGTLAVFPATATSHTLTVKYRDSGGGGTASFKNRRLWAWIL